MPHIHTEPRQHDLTTSAYIVRLDTPEPTLMLHIHRKIGIYMQFGGHVEFDESPWRSITREIREESGYQIDQIGVYQPKNRVNSLKKAVLHPQPICLNTHLAGDTTQHYHISIDFAFYTNERPNEITKDRESKDTKLFTLQMLKDADDSIMYANVRDIGIYVLEEVAARWDKVPASVFTT